MKRSMFFVLLFLLLSSLVVQATDVTFAWDPKTDVGLTGYKLYYGTATRTYTKNVLTGNVTTYKVTGVAPGKWFFAVVALFGTSETGYSNEVSVTVPVPPPPTNLRLVTPSP